MKRWIALSLLLLLLVGCAAPAVLDPKLMDQPIRFYYVSTSDEHYSTEDGALDWVPHDLGKDGETLEETLSSYLQGPKDSEILVSPFPDGLEITVQSLESGMLTLHLSDGIADLSGVQRTLAVACLVRTLSQLEEIQSIRLICDALPEQGLFGSVLTEEQFLLVDDTATSNQTTVKLYFPETSGRYLSEETRERAFDSVEQIPSYIVRQLLEGPTMQDHGTMVPEGTRLNTIWIRDGVCKLDLSLDFVRNPPETHQQARMTVFSIVNSLTELSYVDCVQIQSGGQTIRDYGGLDLSQPIYREEFAIAQDRDERRYDATLYLAYGQNPELAAVPMTINRTSGRSLEADVLNALLAYDPANGYESPISDGVVVMDLDVSNGLCSVTFNRTFALCDADRDLAQKAVRSVVGTLCELENIDRVQINIHQAELTNVDLSQSISMDADWIME